MPPHSHEATLALIDRLRRSRGAPLLLGPSARELLARESALPADEIVAHTLRSAADRLVSLQRRAAEAGADLLFAPTAQTSAAALRSTGFAYRAAALTGAAIELTRDAALAAGGRRAGASIAGEIHLDGAGGRATAEAPTHLERLAVASVDVVAIEAHDPELAGADELLELAAAHALPAVLVARAAGLGAVPSSCAALILEGRGDEIAATIARLRRTNARLRFGALLREEGDETSSQLAAQGAWGALAPLDLDLLGARGPSALAALRALRELARGAS